MPGMHTEKDAGTGTANAGIKDSIDYTTEEGKLVLDLFFEDRSFYIIKKISGTAERTPEDILFQGYGEFGGFLSQFDTGQLYDCNGALFFHTGPDELYEIRRVTFEGEALLESMSYDTDQHTIDLLWTDSRSTQQPCMKAGTDRIRDRLYSSYGNGVIYANEPKLNEVIESHAYMGDDGFYKVGGRTRLYRGPVFQGELGEAVERFIHELFRNGPVIVKDCFTDKLFIISEYAQLSVLWDKTGYIEVRDEDGDLSLYCTRDKSKHYIVRTITKDGLMYLDLHRSGYGLPGKIWDTERYARHVYRRPRTHD